MHHSVETLASRFDVTLIGPSGCAKFAAKNVSVVECPPAPFSFLIMALLRGWRFSNKKKFDLVLGGSGLVAPVTWFLSRIAKGRSLIFVHGLDLVVDNAVYQWLFVPFLRHHDRVIANSQNTREIAVGKGCQSNRVKIVNPGSTIPPESTLLDATQSRARLGFEDKKIILFVGRIVRRKGLAEFVEKAWPRIVAVLPEALLLVAGDSPDDALLKDSGGAKRVVQAIGRCGRETVHFLGTVDDDMLSSCYAAADVLVFPLIRVSGDVEGFGMVAIEAAASGTPTVAFPVGGVVDAVADGINGVLVPEGDYEAFADAVLSICQGGPPDRSSCRNYAEKFSWDAHAQNLLAALEFSGDPSR